MSFIEQNRYLLVFSTLLVLLALNLQQSNAQKLPWAYTLYPYGRDYNDTYTARDKEIGSGMIQLGFNLTFMGHRFNQAWVHHAGYITFQNNTKFSINTDWPHPQWPQIDDPIFIAPFYCRIELNNDIYATGELETDFYKDDNYGRVMFRTVERFPDFVHPPPTRNLTTRELFEKRSNEMLNVAQDNIRDSVSGAEHFVAHFALVATWGNVTFAGINVDRLDVRPRNSYQAVIVTDYDGDYTYAIFNYERIEWSASTEFGGDATTGLSKTHAAKIGFNRGNGTEFYKVLPFNDNPKEILSLNLKSNVDHKGRFIFRIDEWIQPAGCKNEYSKGNLFIWPLYGNMLGGQEVNITGPCFGEYKQGLQTSFFQQFETFCRWGDDPNSPITKAEVITILRARCVMPTVFYTGRINLWVSVDGKHTFDWKAEFSIVDPIRFQPKVILEDVDQWLKPVPKTQNLTLKWDIDDLGWSRNETVEIQLYGYYEDDVPHWDFLQTLGERIPNKGVYEFSVKANWAVEQNRARRYKVGAVAVTLMSGGTEEPKKIWSQLQPLGWWRNNEMDILYDREKILFGSSRGRNWMEDQCRWWHEYERWDRFWMYDLERCPCTMNFAVSDMGRWAPDPECNMNRAIDDPNNCLLHRGAVHCVVNIKPTVSGGGSRCCYNFEGNLMYTNDTKSGSTSDRFHIFGIPPYNIYGRVPALSHYLHDMVPFFLCCEWSDLCDSYLYLRETADCKGYRYPKAAAIYGDPHIKTFDGQEYTFNARGEFRLLVSTRHNFILQGRFERPPNATFCAQSSAGQINATRLTAIVAKEDGSDKIEVRTRIYPSQSWRFKCDLYINGRQWFINETDNKLQFFKNVSITIPYNDDMMSNMTIMFNTTGTGVQVSCGLGMLHVKVSAPPIMFFETEGLLGYWNNDPDDEFRTQGGVVIPPDAGPANISNDFAMLWRLEYEKDSLFTYSGSYGFNKFHDRKEYIHTWMQFVPWYTWSDVPFPTGIGNVEPFNPSQLEYICDGDEQCKYDAKAMGSLEIGESTKHNHRYYSFLHEAMKPLNSCGIMSIRGGIRKTNTGNYLAGSRMTVSCDRYYTFYGHREYICHPNGTWLPSNGVPLHKFKSWPQCEHYHITALKYSAIGIGSIFCILMIIAFIFFFKNYDPDEEKYPKKKKNNQNGNNGFKVVQRETEPELVVYDDQERGIEHEEFEGRVNGHPEYIEKQKTDIYQAGRYEEDDEVIEKNEYQQNSRSRQNLQTVIDDDEISQSTTTSNTISSKSGFRRPRLLNKPLISQNPNPIRLTAVQDAPDVPPEPIQKTVIQKDDEGYLAPSEIDRQSYA